MNCVFTDDCVAAKPLKSELNSELFVFFFFLFWVFGFVKSELNSELFVFFFLFWVFGFVSL